MEIPTNNAMVRWAFDFDAWKPTGLEWEKILLLVQPEERLRLGRFKRPIGNGVYLIGKDNPDAKSSLVGRLMQRKMVHDIQKIDYKDIILLRTTKGKPYFEQSKCRSEYPNFNFNVSHQGDFVVGGCDGEYIFGVDVMKVDYRGQTSGTNKDFFRDMKDCFTSYEWKVIESHKNPLESFYTNWCLKESYIKAIGIGLGFELQRAEFHIDNENNTAFVLIDTIKQNNWHFELHELPQGHVSACAYGPPDHADPVSSAGINMQHKVSPPSDIPRIPYKIVTVDHLILDMMPL
jgi:4'-phosphopantetheinyl transferase